MSKKLKKGYFDRSELEKYIGEGGFTVEKHPDANIYIYGYHARAYRKKNWDDINVNFRGLILDEYGKVMARPFPKFFTFRKYLSEDTILSSEGQIQKIPSGEFKMYEKLDGSLAILYWLNDQPYLSSQRSFTSLKAKKATEILHKKYTHLFDSLDKKNTYLFEAIYPEARVAVDYGDVEDLYLIGIIDNETGKDLLLKYIGFPMAKDYTEELGVIKDLQSLQNLNLTNKEGFVLLYEEGLRVKIKFRWFLEVSRLISKLVNNDHSRHQLIQRLKIQMGIPTNRLTNQKVWDLLEEGKSVEYIQNCISELFFYAGAEEWLSQVVQEYNETKAKVKRNPKINKNKKPQPEKVEEFDFKNRWNQASTEMIMWNKINLIKEFFD